MTKLEELKGLTDRLKRLDDLFVELYRYADASSVSMLNGQQSHQALRAIKNTIGNRTNVIPQAIALISAQTAEIERLRRLLLPFADEAFTYDCDEDTDEKKLIPGEYFLMIEEGDGTLTESAIRVDDLRKARAALQLSPDGMGGE